MRTPHARPGGAIRVGVIGWGYWGPNLGRNVAASRECWLAGIADHSAGRRAAAHQDHPGVVLHTRGEELITDPRIDAVIIATSVHAHFDLALAALRAGKHVLIEKPIAESSEQALILIEESDRRGLTLMVDHTFLFSPAVRAIRELLNAGALGQLRYFDSARLNLGIVRRDVNVLWDVASHDLALLDYFTSAPPITVQAVGVAPIPGGREHLAWLTLTYADGFSAHVNASWISPVKVRRLFLGGSARMLIYDDLAPRDRVTVFDGGTPATPELSTAEPLREVVRHFVACINRAERPISDGATGFRVVRQLEAADRSMREHGRPVQLDPEWAFA
jgi:predicted dehydrogenase